MDIAYHYRTTTSDKQLNSVDCTFYMYGNPYNVKYSFMIIIKLK